MKDIIFQPIDFKYPMGAVSDIESSDFAILVKKSLNHNSVNIVIYSDAGDFLIKEKMNYSGDTSIYSKYNIRIKPLVQGLYFYYFELVYNDVVYKISNYDLNAEFGENFTPWQLTVYDNEYKTPQWIKGGIIYQIFPDRFHKSTHFTALKAVNESERIRRKNWLDIPNSKFDTPNYSAKDFFMGNLLGISEQKKYLHNLGVDLIYLNPIFESSENHRYSTADYFNIDPYLGNNNSFTEMCEELSDVGIKVILDGVFNHVGADSLYFNRYSRYNNLGAYNSVKSNYYNWFHFIDYPNKYDSWWGFENLPTIEKKNSSFRNFILNNKSGVIKFWQDKGAAGWRLDVADELSDVFLDELRSSVKSIDEDALIIGEVWEDASNKVAYSSRRRYLQGKQLDSVMNYPWKNAIIDFMKDKNAEKFSIKILDIINNYPSESLDCMMNILSTHDTERIITSLGVDFTNFDQEKKKDYLLTDEQYKNAVFLEKFASFLQFTLPGVPSVYYGDEIGMQGFSDPFNRACFNFANVDSELLTHYKELASFRKKYKENFETGFEFGFAEGNVVAFYRNNILCIVNLSNDSIIYDEVLSGNWIYGNKKPFFTDYGVVVGPKSYVAVEVSIKKVYSNKIDRYLERILRPR